MTLASRELNTYHTAQNIAIAIKSIIHEYNIDIEKVSGITTDRAANMIAGAALVTRNHVACFAHALNTIVHKLLDDKFIQPVLE